MGKKSTGIYKRQNGSWVVDKRVENVRFYQSFGSYEDAEAWLTRELEALRQTRVHGAISARHGRSLGTSRRFY